MVQQALEAAEQLAAEGISVEVIDPRTLAPLDIDTILASVHKTGRLLVVDEDFAPVRRRRPRSPRRSWSAASTTWTRRCSRLNGLFAPAPYSPPLFDTDGAERQGHRPGRVLLADSGGPAGRVTRAGRMEDNMPFEVVMPRLGWNMETGTPGRVAEAGRRARRGRRDPLHRGGRQGHAGGRGAGERHPAHPARLARRRARKCRWARCWATCSQPARSCADRGAQAAIRRSPTADPDRRRSSQPRRIGRSATSQPAIGRTPPTISPRARRVAGELGVDWTGLQGQRPHRPHRGARRARRRPRPRESAARPAAERGQPAGAPPGRRNWAWTWTRWPPRCPAGASSAPTSRPRPGDAAMAVAGQPPAPPAPSAPLLTAPYRRRCCPSPPCAAPSPSGWRPARTRSRPSP